jgi:hypothetical protein
LSTLIEHLGAKLMDKIGKAGKNSFILDFKDKNWRIVDNIGENWYIALFPKILVYIGKQIGVSALLTS